ncbi:chemoreceptor glutamine deamidase CheD [Methylophaga thiooxydans]|uniref:chemoreceptor glutamine deamidase CheD n=1 Tax=Methylophaga thiooxydans TaxID=392484 RepID=UPI002354CC08|nr:chemoreceptor glutamine deamidase CheD [Methylophaga thiooxydans]
MMLSRPPQPPVLTGFEHINRYWDVKHNGWAAKILPGQLYVTTDLEEVICTTLGSCLSACIRDKKMGIGGMNHFMLPIAESNASGAWDDQATRYGSFAMERLINEIMKAGGRRENLEMKVTGGAHVIESMANKVGQRNIDFILAYAEVEGLEMLSQDLGDIYPRKVMYYPGSGRLRVKRLRTLHNTTLLQREAHYVHELEVQPAVGDVELF